jgi:hypothetical protein
MTESTPGIWRWNTRNRRVVGTVERVVVDAQGKIVKEAKVSTEPSSGLLLPGARHREANHFALQRTLRPGNTTRAIENSGWGVQSWLTDHRAGNVGSGP